MSVWVEQKTQGQIFSAEAFPRPNSQGITDGAFKFANISGPSIPQHCRHRLLREPARCLSLLIRMSFQEIVYQ
jgi:hypothetical protein